MKVLGISAFYHDSAAALIEDGRIIAAAQEERFSRRRHDARFPSSAIAFCLQFARTKVEDVDLVVFYEKPYLKFERLLETYVGFAPRGLASFAMAMPLWVQEKLFLRRFLVKEFSELSEKIDWDSRLMFSEHHYSHAASAFFPSPFSEAAILTVDGVGEWATTTLALGNDTRIEMLREIRFPHSLGLLYSAFTYYLGFRVNSGEYKVMGLAPYGSPTYRDTILGKLIDLKDDGSFRLDMSFFDYATGLRMTNDAFAELFGGLPRNRQEPLTQRHMDIAASIQSVLDEAMLRIARDLASRTGQRKLCMAGGVALNCVSNGKLLRSGLFSDIWIQPAAGDAGGAIGAALGAYHLAQVNEPRRTITRSSSGDLDGMNGSFLGPEYSQSEIETRLKALGARFRVLSDDTLISTAVHSLERKDALGWFQGRMEFGPRALGARSILADPRDIGMQSKLNLKIKFRESFRPFAPAVLRESLTDWFDLDVDSPYMLFVADVAARHRIHAPAAVENASGLERLKIPRSDIPAATHVDGSARIQTVHRETNPLFHDLLSAFAAKTGYPVLVNTSFNVRGEPIVCTPDDAFRCFMGTGLDSLAIGNCFLRKADQDDSLGRQYEQKFEAD
ncbi:MAG TPA: carbamoyltransferase [Gemmatimonadaceae bacterium]|nr:carbamoyltransferase [Gemmatimonadaceae bacterium]